ncbi:HupE/UreJ family protein [Ferruginibacter yonginensis]|uniref:HupE/UreJ family protein n=1 Tax=Ferruginibacter yonginensis TaxID=1310416 RepID=A0ABV8QR69_9BACT
MNDLAFYFKEGWQHIISWDALDHQLFIIALAAIYVVKDWKQVLVLVTAFTIGHSATLALSVYDVVRINDKWVEFLIPCTIVITAIFNFFQTDFTQKKWRLNYFFALFFGLIHGLGFANTIRFMLAKNQTIGWSLFGFNVGLEAGQIIVVFTILLLSYLCINLLKIERKWWVYFLSSATLIAAAIFAFQRLP